MEEQAEEDMAFEEDKQEDEITPCDERTAESLFRKLIRRFENVRNVSSPVLKLITIHRQMNELMTALNEAVN